jgi:hypothetical protein
MKDPVSMVGEAPLTDGKNIMLLTTSIKNSGNNCRVTLVILFMVFFYNSIRIQVYAEPVL